MMDFISLSGETFSSAIVLLAFLLVVAMLHTNITSVTELLFSSKLREAPEKVTSNDSQSQPQGNPYDAVACKYDASFCDTRVGTLLRRKTWVVLEKAFKSEAPDSARPILEVSCGTGEDALWLASHRVKVLATDVSAGMLEVARAKLESSPRIEEEWKPSFQQLDIEALHKSYLLQQHNISGVFSNFGGMNNVDPECVRHMAHVLAKILPPGAKVVLVVMGRFCLFETLYYLLRFKMERAFRRLRSSRSRGISLRVCKDKRCRIYFHSLQDMQDAFLSTSAFCLVDRRAIGLAIPPSLWSNSASRKVPEWLLSFLDDIDALLSRLWPFVNWGDHYLVEFERIIDERPAVNQ